MAAGLRVAGHLPGGLRDGTTEAARQAFINGLHSGSLVAAGTFPGWPASAAAGRAGRTRAGRKASVINTADREMAR